jgi:hypothetical protein
MQSSICEYREYGKWAGLAARAGICLSWGFVEGIRWVEEGVGNARIRQYQWNESGLRKVKRWRRKS